MQMQSSKINPIVVDDCKTGQVYWASSPPNLSQKPDGSSPPLHAYTRARPSNYTSPNYSPTSPKYFPTSSPESSPPPIMYIRSLPVNPMEITSRSIFKRGVFQGRAQEEPEPEEPSPKRAKEEPKIWTLGVPTWKSTSGVRLLHVFFTVCNWYRRLLNKKTIIAAETGSC